MIDVECLLQADDAVGESPLWHAASQTLYWVDIPKPAVKALSFPDRVLREWTMPEPVGSIGLAPHGLVAGMKSGFRLLDLDAGSSIELARLPPQAAHMRCNDGKCDRGGRFWCGTIDDRDFGPDGVLYRLDRHGLAAVDSGFVLVNGIAFSPDDRFLYMADSRREIVYRYAFDLGSGEVADRQPFISTEDVKGRVDGATVAADGTYWCAHVRGSQVAQYDPSGRLMRVIPLPVSCPLMCTFGGADLSTLFVTSSRALAGPDEPLAGAVFAIHGLEARGIPEPVFRV